MHTGTRQRCDEGYRKSISDLTFAAGVVVVDRRALVPARGSAAAVVAAAAVGAALADSPPIVAAYGVGLVLLIAAGIANRRQQP